MNDFSNKVINWAFRVDPLDLENIRKYVDINYTDENRSQLIADAQRRKVLPVVGKFMMKLQIDCEYWKNQYNFFLDRNTKVTKLLEKIFDSLWEHNVNKICAYENYGALLASGVDIALYSSGDVDLFADIKEKEEISRVLSAFGYYPTMDGNDLMGICTEYLKQDGIIRINVAWKPLIRFSLPIKAGFQEYFVWEEMGYYNNTRIRLPSKETLLYMCFLRIAVHGYSRSPDIRLYIDTFTSSRNNPSWSCVIEWAKKDGVLTKFCTVAAIANDLIGLDVPLDVLETAKQDKYAQRILSISYDFDRHTLKYDPSGVMLLKLEAASDNRSVLGEVMCMLFPQSNWIKEYYCLPGDGIGKGYLNYYKRLL